MKKTILIILLLRNIRRLLYTPKNTPTPDSLLLIAHPDDESMFFSPFLYYNRPEILCLSKGMNTHSGIMNTHNGTIEKSKTTKLTNNNKETRSKELHSLCHTRGWKVTVLDYPDGEDWDTQEIAVDLAIYCIKNKIRNIVTFDKGGVSGHKNHVACYKSARFFKAIIDTVIDSVMDDSRVVGDNSDINNSNSNDNNSNTVTDNNNITHTLKKLSKNIKFFHLKTTTILEKYFFSLRKPFYSIPIHSIFGIVNMSHHRSQLVWYRYIYVLVSNYMHFNEFN